MSFLLTECHTLHFSIICYTKPSRQSKKKFYDQINMGHINFFQRLTMLVNLLTAKKSKTKETLLVCSA